MKKLPLITIILVLYMILFIGINSRIGQVEKDQVKILQHFSDLQDQFIEHLKSEIDFKRSLRKARENRTKRNVTGG